MITISQSSSSSPCIYGKKGKTRYQIMTRGMFEVDAWLTGAGIVGPFFYEHSQDAYLTVPIVLDLGEDGPLVVFVGLFL